MLTGCTQSGTVTGSSASGDCNCPESEFAARRPADSVFTAVGRRLLSATAPYEHTGTPGQKQKIMIDRFVRVECGLRTDLLRSPRLSHSE
jgi:hypothetical protein